MAIVNFDYNVNNLCEFLKNKALYEDVSIMNYYNLVKEMQEYIHNLESAMKQLEIYINDMWLDDKGSVRRLQEFYKIVKESINKDGEKE